MYLQIDYITWAWLQVTLDDHYKIWNIVFYVDPHSGAYVDTMKLGFPSGATGETIYKDVDNNEKVGQ